MFHQFLKHVNFLYSPKVKGTAPPLLLTDSNEPININMGRSQQFYCFDIFYVTFFEISMPTPYLYHLEKK